jgi:type VI protein secretion system component VasK
VPDQSALWMLGTLLAVWLMVMAATTVWVLACWRQRRRARAGWLTGRHRRGRDPHAATATVQEIRHRLNSERQRQRRLRARPPRRVTVLARLPQTARQSRATFGLLKARESDRFSR